MIARDGRENYTTHSLDFVFRVTELHASPTIPPKSLCLRARVSPKPRNLFQERLCSLRRRNIPSAAIVRYLYRDSWMLHVSGKCLDILKIRASQFSEFSDRITISLDPRLCLTIIFKMLKIRSARQFKSSSTGDPSKG